MQHNSFITSTNLRQHVVANKPTNKYKRCMSSHKTILCHRVFFFWPNPKYFSADYPAASVCHQEVRRERESEGTIALCHRRFEFISLGHLSSLRLHITHTG